MSTRGLKINEVKRLHKAGLGRNAIARTLGISTRQVDNAAKAAGISFTTARTYAAVRARQSAIAQDREELAELARVKAHEVMDLLEAVTDPLELKRLVSVVAELLDIDVRATAAVPGVEDYENDPAAFHLGRSLELVADIDDRIVSLRQAKKASSTTKKNTESSKLASWQAGIYEA